MDTYEWERMFRDILAVLGTDGQKHKNDGLIVVSKCAVTNRRTKRETDDICQNISLHMISFVVSLLPVL